AEGRDEFSSLQLISDLSTVNSNNAPEPDEIEPIKSQYIEQGLIKELLNSNPIISSVIIPEYQT
ncbi:12891_t:CDS:2, partial [Dentiscutata erythropus]